MQIKELHSITEIKPGDCYQTGGSRPIKVFCNDLNYYVCKYYTGSGFCNSLFNEYIAARFLKIWKLPVPEFAFVNIKTDHIKHIEYPYHYFDKSCFGSRFYGEYPEVDKLFIEFPALKNNPFPGWESFLKIGLFDIWLCNEDRNFNNYNLLFNTQTNEFVPIDHVFCFNGNNTGKEPVLLSENESILTSPLLNRFFSRSLQRNFNETRLILIKEFKQNVNRCHEALEDILAHTPLTWNPDHGFLRTALDIYFQPAWLKQCEDLFTTLLTLQINSH
jgi:hypothetical protein